MADRSFSSFPFVFFTLNFFANEPDLRLCFSGAVAEKHLQIRR